MVRGKPTENEPQNDGNDEPLNTQPGSYSGNTAGGEPTGGAGPGEADGQGAAERRERRAAEHAAGLVLGEHRGGRADRGCGAGAGEDGERLGGDQAVGVDRAGGDDAGAAGGGRQPGAGQVVAA